VNARLWLSALGLVGLSGCASTFANAPPEPGPGPIQDTIACTESQHLGSGDSENASAFDRPAVAKQRVGPNYPADAIERKITGTVTVRARVCEHGNVVQAQVLSGPVLLRESAIAAVSQYQFDPASSKGSAVPSWTTIPLVFSIH
jgi:TonB family protein